MNINKLLVLAILMSPTAHTGEAINVDRPVQTVTIMK